ncbi:MAG: MarR family winged helix-turn-helix transcriptional regulator [Actinomycetota bacterium]|nr:MarR family winged helix-turn-helix transcriptional regulator [Actinomycetota bacterium]
MRAVLPTSPVHGDADARPAGGALESGLGFRLGRAHRILREAWDRRIADLGLTPPQAAMLRAACEWRGCGLRELARRTHTDPMNAKRLADHLERAGLVRSTTDPDHRQRRVLEPTPDGLAIAAELSGRAAAWGQRLSDLVGADDIARIQALLDRLEQVVLAAEHGDKHEHEHEPKSKHSDEGAHS